jgi:energy-coupling factor transporter transmembrane protein EcfT
MAELTLFNYRSGDSILHTIDARFKLICLILISISILNAYPLELSVLTLAIVAVLTNLRVSFSSILKEFRYVAIFLLFIFITRAIFASNVSSPSDIVFKGVTISRQGLYDGAVICWRLVIIVMVGLSFVVTTRPSEIKAAVQWYLTPIPFIPAKRVAVMMSLMMRFVPVIFNQAKATLDAQRARGVENRKNPVYRLIKFTVPLIRRTFENADKLADAMEARCYCEYRTDPELTSTRKDWLFLLVAICLCVLIKLFDYCGSIIAKYFF